MINNMNELSELALKYGTDKGPSPGHHNYTKHYHNLFSPIRDSVRSVLELGVHQGASLRMWRDYFPSAIIYGLDYAKEVTEEYLVTLGRETRFQIFIGDQRDEDTLSELVQYGTPFDIMVDDASHLPLDYLFSLKYLWKHTKEFYVIEDIEQQFIADTLAAIRDLPMANSAQIPSACSDRVAIAIYR